MPLRIMKLLLNSDAAQPDHRKHTPIDKTEADRGPVEWRQLKWAHGGGAEEGQRWGGGGEGGWEGRVVDQQARESQPAESIMARKAE